MSKYFFSIIVPTCNREDELLLCLEAIMANKIGFETNGNFEVIVSDDGSFNISNILLSKFPDVRWVQGPRKGPAANRNHGAKFASGEWLIFLDDDCLPSNDLLNNYNSAIRNTKEYKVFEGAILPIGEKKAMDEESPINNKGGKLWSCNFCIHSDLFLKIGGFDERFRYAAMEDVELNYRLQKNGIAILFVDKAIVKHPWKSKLNIYQSVFNHFESTMYFVQKYPELGNKFNRGFYMNVIFRSVISVIKNFYKFKGRGFKNRILYVIAHVHIVFFRKMSLKD